MSESKTVTIPVGLNEGPAQPAQPEPESGFVNGVYQPPTRRVSLHRVRMERPQAEAKASVPAQQPSQADALNQQMAATLQAAVTALAASQIGNVQRGYAAPERDVGALEKLMLHNQYGSGPFPEDGGSQPQWDGPDPDRFDFYDEQDAADFHRLSNDHIQQEVRRGVETELAARHKASEGERLHGQLNAAEAKFKRDANYAETMQAAIDRVADSGWKLSIEEAYLQVSGETEARSGQRRSSYLPKDLKTLGDILRYKQQTGRIDR